MKTFKFSLMLRNIYDDNIYGIHSKRINILYVFTKNIRTDRPKQTV